MTDTTVKKTAEDLFNYWWRELSVPLKIAVRSEADRQFVERFLDAEERQRQKVKEAINQSIFDNA